MDSYDLQRQIQEQVRRRLMEDERDSEDIRIREICKRQAEQKLAEENSRRED